MWCTELYRQQMQVDETSWQPKLANILTRDGRAMSVRFCPTNGAETNLLHMAHARKLPRSRLAGLIDDNAVGLLLA